MMSHGDDCVGSTKSGFETTIFCSERTLAICEALKEPTSIHWHGILLPTSMDGVPYVSQEPIPPNGKMVYRFPLKQSGTYWMHSHFGLQEQLLGSAPMILESEEQKAKADEHYVVFLSDFSFKPPGQILKELKAGMKKMKSMSGMNEMSKKEKLITQKWDDGGHRFVPARVEDELPDTDVKYDALIANRRTLDDPEVFRVKRGHTVLLRIIAGCS
jgi:FtsP/CotA-like multicopper oxidase with cupredoxin domain